MGSTFFVLIFLSRYLDVIQPFVLKDIIFPFGIWLSIFSMFLSIYLFIYLSIYLCYPEVFVVGRLHVLFLCEKRLLGRVAPEIYLNSNFKLDLVRYIALIYILDLVWVWQIQLILIIKICVQILNWYLLYSSNQVWVWFSIYQNSLNIAFKPVFYLKITHFVWVCCEISTAIQSSTFYKPKFIRSTYLSSYLSISTYLSNYLSI